MTESELRLTYEVLNNNEEELRRSYQRELQTVEQYLGWIRNDVDGYMRSLRPLVERLVSERKNRLLANAGPAASLGIPIRRRADESGACSPPEIRRKPQIERPAAPTGNFVPEPSLSTEEYDRILAVLELSTAVMEKSPSAFAVMGEEDIRSHLLVQLNGRYEVQGAAEAFNHLGKTDILLPYDGRDVFIAECKFWGGPKLFRGRPISCSATRRGATPRRPSCSSTAIRTTQGVVEKIAATVAEHPCFLLDLGRRGKRTSATCSDTLQTRTTSSTSPY